MGKIKKNDNLLALIPVMNSELKWRINEEGNVQMVIPRTKMLDTIVRKFIKTPETMVIDLDEMGSFIWNQIDGKKSVGEIAIHLKEEFGEMVEPLYERLGIYLNILRNNKWIELNKE